MALHMRKPTLLSGWNSTPLLPLLFLAACAALLRVGAVSVRWSHLSADPDAYRLIAENLAQRGVFSRSPDDAVPVPTAFRPPLYPLVLSATARQGRVTPWSVAIIHVVLGALTVVGVWMLGQQWGLGRGSWLAAGLVAVDPILLHQASEVMTETFATFLCVLGLLALTQWSLRATYLHAATAGVALGLTLLCRPTFLIWAALCGLYMLATSRCWKGVAQTLVFGAAILAILLPWGMRNYWAFGRPIVTTTHGGYTLLLANNPYFYEHLRTEPWGSVWDARDLVPRMRPDTATPPALSGRELSEIESDRCLYELARQSMRAQPHMFLAASLVRVGNLWTPLAHRLDVNEPPLVRWSRWVIAVWYVGVFAGAAVGVGRLGWRVVQVPWVWGGLLVLALTLVHAVYWTNMRMRAPLMPMVDLAVAAAGCRIRPPSKSS
jgi:4-amino-4-deoxy-L-arabinose transferase-like glycosyltransferase